MVYKQNFIKIILLQAEKENCPKIVRKMSEIVLKNIFMNKTYFAGQKIIKYILYFFSQKNEFLIWRRKKLSKNCPKIDKIDKVQKTTLQKFIIFDIFVFYSFFIYRLYLVNLVS